MRLSKDQRQQIVSVIQAVLGGDAVVTLFGSRADDQAKGGDIDLLVETTKRLANVADIRATIAAKLYLALRGRKVDVLLSAPNLKHFPIHDIAKKKWSALVIYPDEMKARLLFLKKVKLA